MKKNILITLILISSILFISNNIYARMHKSWGGQLAAPTLLEPITSNVDLTGKQMLKFLWVSNIVGSIDRNYFDFRLYKGTQMTEDNIIYKEKLAPRTRKLELKADIFQEGETYSWSLRYSINKQKSDLSWRTFKVIKK